MQRQAHASGSSRSLHGRLVCIGTLSIVLLATPAGGTVATGTASDGDDSHPPFIVLDVVPFTDPVATTVQIDARRRLSAFRYSSGALQIQSWQPAAAFDAGKQAEIQQAVDAVSTRSLCRPSVGDGLRRGDQFRLALAPPSSVTTRCAGFVSDAPPALQRLIKLLIRLARPMAAEVPSSDFVRARPLESERHHKLRASGGRFVALGDDSAPAAGTLRQAIAQAPALVPVRPSDADPLRGQMPPSGQLFVEDADGGWEIRIFHGRSVP